MPKYIERDSLLKKAKSLQNKLFAVPLILDAIEYQRQLMWLRLYGVEIANTDMFLTIVLYGTEQITVTNISSKEGMTFIAVSVKRKKVQRNERQISDIHSQR